MSYKKRLLCDECGRGTLIMVSTTAITSCWRCTHCSNEVQRPVRKVDKHRLLAMFNPSPRNNCHRVWHLLCKKFRNADNTWKLEGCELIDRLGSFALQHPKHVTVVRCDDASHMGARLFLVQHRADSGRQYHGTTVLFVPQVGPVAEFFLYPDHADGLVASLCKIKKLNKNWKYSL